MGRRARLWWALSAESNVGAPGGGVAHRGRLLEGDADAAARGVFDGLFGLVVEVVVLQAVSGRSRGGEMGAGARATHPSDRRTWPRRTMEGGIAWMWRNGKRERVRVCVCERVRKGFCGPSKGPCVRKGTCSLSDTEGKAKVFAFVSMGADTKANTRELVREAGSLLEQLQRRVAVEALSESGASLGAEAGVAQTASRGVWLVVRSVNER